MFQMDYSKLEKTSSSSSDSESEESVYSGLEEEPDTSVCTGVSKLFSFGARFKIAGAPGSEAEGFTEAQSTERGRVGEGDPLPQVGVRGASPGKFFGKLPQKGAFWRISGS